MAELHPKGCFKLNLIGDGIRADIPGSLPLLLVPVNSVVSSRPSVTRVSGSLCFSLAGLFLSWSSLWQSLEEAKVLTLACSAPVPHDWGLLKLLQERFY